MANILDIVRGLNQAASNAHDGALDKDGEPVKVGLRREEGNAVLDSRLMDGFSVKFSADKMLVTYQSEILMKEVHPRNQFENGIEERFGDIVKFLKKEYRKIMKESVSLKDLGDADILVQATSRHRNWVQAVKQYKVGGADGVGSLGEVSSDKLDANIKKFIEKHTTKKANKAPKNPDTPEA